MTRNSSNRHEQLKLFAVGNVTEDILFRVRRLPRAGETLIAEDRRVDIGGKGLNQAIVAARCGVPVTLVAAIGKDDAGARARAVTQSEPLRARLLETDTATDQSIIAIAGDGENMIISSASSASALAPRDIDAELKEAAAGDLLLMQGNLSLETTRHALQTMRDRGVFTYLNPSPIQWPYDGIWPFVHTVVANRHELAELTRRNDLDDGIREMLSAGVETVLVTLGADGARLVCADRELHVDALPAEAIDTAGAGDTFCGAFIGATMKGHSAEYALAAAVRASAITVSRRGTHSAFPSAAQMHSILHDQT